MGCFATALVLCGGMMSAMSATEDWPHPAPVLQRRVALPDATVVARTGAEGPVRFAGDVRVGDLDGDGELELVVYRCRGGAVAGEGMTPCWLAAVGLDGRLRWQVGEPGSGEQPARPGPVLVHDIDGDGRAEVLCFWAPPQVPADPTSLAGTRMRIHDGRTGKVRLDAAGTALHGLAGKGANWVHQRLLAVNLRGGDRARDLVVKVGARVLAFDGRLEPLWHYDNPHTKYTECPAYIPCVGDVDGDGRDEVLGGYFLLGPDGKPRWEAKLGRNMDSVAIAPWDDGRVRCFASGEGHVVDGDGTVLLRLGAEVVPHGQELRVGRFIAGDDRPAAAIRWNGHRPDLLVVANDGTVARRLRLNDSHNHTGMERVRWHGDAGPDLLFNGGMLWDLGSGASTALPDLPTVPAHGRMSWWHAVPLPRGDGAGDDLCVYNPWHPEVYLYRRADLGDATHANSRELANVRLMD